MSRLTAERMLHDTTRVATAVTLAPTKSTKTERTFSSVSPSPTMIPLLIIEDLPERRSLILLVRYEEKAYAAGLTEVAAGPPMRSSYHAEAMIILT